MVRAWISPSSEPSSSLQITISGMPTKKPRSVASEQKSKATKKPAILETSKSVEFKPAFDGRGDRAGRVRYLSKEYCLRDDGNPKELGAVISPLERQRKWQRQEEELRGMVLSPSNGTYLLTGRDHYDGHFYSRGRDGYNSPFHSRGRDGYNGPFHSTGRDGYNGPFDCVVTGEGAKYAFELNLARSLSEHFSYPSMNLKPK
ncbi:uncharacterized protein BDZ99DRAFT_526710 [Mytilinidion resinicola]|uniref:Uncharacterized protein n=1 Tax=Mytilinidion resinicola TaxID=574789 RepID=A0A6A6Y498_9PEZI|nr:uncharacterized protein BDZ99DRAFT_526710 [Mytilinidion resinicola]KAF2803348.1 hypothetical protein BDZ99DRAFT_526710 [Mytilinidion resinicola]